MIQGCKHNQTINDASDRGSCQRLKNNHKNPTPHSQNQCHHTLPIQFSCVDSKNNSYCKLSTSVKEDSMPIMECHDILQTNKGLHSFQLTGKSSTRITFFLTASPLECSLLQSKTLKRFNSKIVTLHCR